MNYKPETDQRIPKCNNIRASVGHRNGRHEFDNHSKKTPRLYANKCQIICFTTDLNILCNVSKRDSTIIDHLDVFVLSRTVQGIPP
jgi:hypothetical protein